VVSEDPCLLDLIELGRLVQARQLSSVEVTEAVLDRIGRFDDQLKSYATLTADLALAQAKQADAEIARGDIRSPVHGVPIAVKDLCCTAGVRTAAGMVIYKDYRPNHDATAVTRLREAGALLLGKLQLTEGAFGAHPCLLRGSLLGDRLLPLHCCTHCYISFPKVDGRTPERHPSAQAA
jgi:amidase